MPLDETYASTGGAAPLRGYLYQVMVSAWVALDVLLRTRTANVIELEPASQEDLEAELEDSSPGAMSNLKASGYQLVVQVKRNGGDPWTVASLRRLLTKEGTSRVNGADRLKNPHVRYLLVTNAALSGPATKLRVRNVGQWPVGDSLPTVLTDHEDKGASERIAVFDNQEEDRVKELVEGMLTTLARVPRSRLAACVGELYNGALARMSGSLPRTWRREELEAFVVAHGGFLAAAPELETYVPPRNWATILSALRATGAVVLKGTSGTGKTLTAEALVAEMRKEHPGLDVLRVSKPSEIQPHAGAGPELIYVDDPWGHFRFEPGAELWNERLPALLRRADSNRMFVVTTRSDVLVDAKAEESVRRWAVAIEGDSYGPREYRKLFSHLVRPLPRPLQTLATSSRATVLRELSTPFELQRYFDSLHEIPAEDYATLDYSHVRRAVSDAHTDSIEKTLQRQVKERGGQIWATVLWGLLKAYGGTTFNALVEVHSAMATIDVDRYESGLNDLVSFLVAGRSLRQNESKLTFYHPRVDAALEGLLSENSIGTQRTLRDLMNGLLALDAAQPGQDWGQEGVARLIAVLRRGTHLRRAVPSDIQSRTDAWLKKWVLSSDAASFEKALELAASAGSENCVAAEVARYITSQAVRNVFDEDEPQFVPRAEWLARMREDEVCEPIVRRFVAEALGVSRGSYHVDFATYLSRLAGDLTKEFLLASEMLVDAGHISSPSEVVFRPALADVEAARALTVKVLDAMDASEGDGVGGAGWLDIENGHYSNAYVEYYSEYDVEWWSQAEEWLAEFVGAMRSRHGWQALNADPLSGRVLKQWMQAAASSKRDPGRAGPTELDCLLRRTLGTEHESQFWGTASVAWAEELRSTLEARIESGGLAGDALEAAVNCLLNATPSSLKVVADSLHAQNELPRVFELFAAVADVTVGPQDVTEFDELLSNSMEYRAAQLARRDVAITAAREISGPIGPLVMALFEIGADAPPTLNDASISVLRSFKELGRVAMMAKLELSALSRCLDREELASVLEAAHTKETAARCVELAADAGFWSLVHSALAHRFSLASAAAIRAIVKHEGGRVPEEILGMASSPSSYVKDALLDSLEASLTSEHLPTLMELVADSFLDGEDFHQDGHCYPFARRAAKLLSVIGPLPREREGRLMQLAQSTEDVTLLLALYTAIAIQGSAHARCRLLEVSAKRGRWRVQTCAANALFAARERLEVELIGKVDHRHALKLHPSTSFALTACVGYVGSEEAVETLAFEISKSADRRVLLLALVGAASGRPAVQERVLSLLPEDHPARAVRLPAAKSISRDAFDDLGDVEAVQVAQKWFSAWLEPKATRS